MNDSSLLQVQEAHRLTCQRAIESGKRPPGYNTVWSAAMAYSTKIKGKRWINPVDLPKIWQHLGLAQ